MRRTGDGSKGVFSNPKPLPGQPGYKQSESAVLEKDAKEMEMRLKQLQDRMKKQQEGDASIAAATSSTATAASAGSSSGSGRWKSARPEKGSIRAYGKDVQDKHRRRQSEFEATGGINTATSGSAKARQLKQQSADAKPSIGSFDSKPVSAWLVDDVSAWLAAIGLQQYTGPFAQNAIDGAVLLDITLEDLDYMSITALGHRKTILKGVEELRRENRFIAGTVAAAAAVGATAVPLQQSASPTRAAMVMRTLSNPSMHSEDHAVTGATLTGAADSLSSRSVTKQQAVEVKKTHWSHLEPLATSQVTNAGAVNINAADGDGSDVLDEAAERAAFQQAVAEWRRSNGSGSSSGVETSTVTAAVVNLTAAGDEMWQNPFAPAANDSMKQPQQQALKGGNLIDEEAAERAAFQAAVADWRSSSAATTTTKVTIVREYLPGTTAAPAVRATTQRGVAPTNASTSSTSAEQGAQRVVRKVSGSSSSNSNITGSGMLLSGALDEEREHAEFVRAVDAWRSRNTDASESDGGRSSAAISVAEKLSQQLEREQQAAAQRLQQQKSAAQERLKQANEDLLKLRAASGVNNYDDSFEDAEETTADLNNTAMSEEKAGDVSISSNRTLGSRGASRGGTRSGDFAASSAAAAAAISIFTYSAAPASITSNSSNSSPQRSFAHNTAATDKEDDDFHIRRGGFFEQEEDDGDNDDAAVMEDPSTSSRVALVGSVLGLQQSAALAIATTVGSQQADVEYIVEEVDTSDEDS